LLRGQAYGFFKASAHRRGRGAAAGRRGAVRERTPTHRAGAVAARRGPKAFRCHREDNYIGVVVECVKCLVK